jgi:hypothetical protein
MKKRILEAVAVAVCGALVFVSGCFLRPNDPPVAVFTASPLLGRAPLSVTLDASSSYDPDGAVEAYRWSFGDGATGTGAFLTHTYSEPGAYTVELTVEDRRQALGTASSVVTARSGTNYAVIVGIAAYVRMRALDFADDDAESVAEELASLPGWDRSRITVLLNSRATKASFAQAVGELSSVEEGDLVFIFFSGHGNRVKDTSGDEADGYDEVLCFYDQDVSDDSLAEFVAGLTASQTVVMLDACYSGGHLNSFGVKGVDGAGAGDGLLEDLARSRGARPQDLDRHPTSLVAISASRVHELSWEYVSLRHGIFTYALLEALGGQADDTGDRDGMTSAEECFAYVGPRVRSLARDGGVAETPQMLDLCPGELDFAGAP